MDLEPVQAFWRLVAHVHPLHARVPRVAPDRRHHALDGVLGTFEHRLHRAVGAVGGPAGDAGGLGLAPHGVPEEDALDPALGPHTPSHVHRGYGNRDVTDLEQALADAGGAGAPPTATAQLRALLLDDLRHGRAELAKARSGYERPVRVGIGAGEDALVAVAPVEAAVRADENVARERDWLVVAALVGALVEAAGGHALALRAGTIEGHLALQLPSTDPDAELAAMAFDERVTAVDRLRARAVVVPAPVLAAPAQRAPIGAGHPLRVAEAVARLGGDPADPSSADELEDQLDGLLGAEAARARPHEDPDPAKRVARRILQRLNGMGKWGGYHTEFAHLPRGFAGNDRSLAMSVGEALLEAGLLAEKPSVGQRHVYLNPRRAGDIHRLIETGEPPKGLTLPAK
jgi:hypothetical protein